MHTHQKDNLMIYAKQDKSLLQGAKTSSYSIFIRCNEKRVEDIAQKQIEELFSQGLPTYKKEMIEKNAG